MIEFIRENFLICILINLLIFVIIYEKFIYYNAQNKIFITKDNKKCIFIGEINKYTSNDLDRKINVNNFVIENLIKNNLKEVEILKKDVNLIFKYKGTIYVVGIIDKQDDKRIVKVYAKER